MNGKPKRSPFVIPLEHIPKGGMEVTMSEADPEFAALLQEGCDGDAAPPTGSARLVLERWPGRLDIEGSLTASLPHICSRGLDPYVQPVEATFRQVLLQSKLHAGPDEEVELGTDDLDRSELVGDSVNLLDVVREELHLALPPKPLCVTPCEGPCPSWGRDLDLSEEAARSGADPRWAALANLKLDK